MAFGEKKNCQLISAINLFITKLNQISALFNDQSPKNEHKQKISSSPN